MNLTLTELRQRLFKLADQVIDTGMPLIIERRGVRLKLVREDAPTPGSRLKKLKAQSLVQGAPLLPDESPSAWSELSRTKVAEGRAGYDTSPSTTTPKPRRAPRKT